MAKAANEEPKLELPDALIQSLVFETFGLRRFTQDSPIRPDVWLRFLKLARWRLAKPRARLKDAKSYRVPLILTPKLTMSREGAPAGHAGKLAEKLRISILKASPEYQKVLKLSEPAEPESRHPFPTFDAGNIMRREEQRILGPFRIAATSRNVGIDVTFEEMMDHVLPLTDWWKRQTYSDKSELEKVLRDQVKKGVTVKQALTNLDDTEFFRFAALSALTQGLLAHSISRTDFNIFCEVLAPIYMAQSGMSDDEKELFPERLADGEGGPLESTKLEEIDRFWSVYRSVVGKKPEKDDSVGTRQSPLSGFQDETLIWSVQLNRPTLRQATTPVAAKVSGRSIQSSVTVKADAAKKLFGVKTSHLVWAIIDTGIDATHPAFLVPDPNTANPTEKNPEDGEAPAVDTAFELKTRVTATLDFTILQDLLSESEDRLDGVIDRICPSDTVTNKRETLKNNLLKSLKAIRDENVAGRQIDWSLLEKLILVNPLEAPKPHDPHGTHVAGILAGGALPNGVVGDTDPFEGVCPDIKIFDLRVFPNSSRTLAGAPDTGTGRPASSGGDEFTVLAALDYVAWLNRDPMLPAIHGINLSLAIPFEVDSHACGRTPICDACDRLVWNGTVVVAAAGNSGFDKDHKQARLGVGYRGMTITDPGNAREVITVGATHHSEPHTYGVSYFSSRGPTGDGRMKPDIVAPGEKIRSTAPGGKMLLMDGTSMAAPHVSGVCALLMGRYRELVGEPERIKQILMNTATDLGRERHFQGAGLVDALRALQSV